MIDLTRVHRRCQVEQANGEEAVAELHLNDKGPSSKPSKHRRFGWQSTYAIHTYSVYSCLAHVASSLVSAKWIREPFAG